MTPATVTRTAPLEVLLDGATAASPAVLVSGAVAINDRVYVDPSTTPLQVTGGLPVTLVTQDELDAVEAELHAVANGKLAKTANLADLTDVAAARLNLGLAGTASADEVLAKAQNLADVPDKAAARTNLGLGAAALETVGTAAGDLVQLGPGGVFDPARIPVTAPSYATLVKLGAA